MTAASDFLRDTLNPGIAFYSGLPGWNVPTDDRARVLLLAFAGIETRWLNVPQAGGGQGRGSPVGSWPP